MLYDLFICHASEDKDSFVRPLAEALRAKNVEVWFDEFSLRLGDSIRRALDKGLRQSRFGAVVLSGAFLSKEWPQYELDGLTEKEIKGGTKVVLPIWHDISHDQVLAYSPPLAGRRAVSSSQGLEKVVSEICAVIHPTGSPLLIARDMLIDWGLAPPVVTDEYWLQVVEASNRIPGFGAYIPEESAWERWSFPLPTKDGGAQPWGEKLAWTAMQLAWVEAAEEISVTPLTPPKGVLEFIHAYPGLIETCKDYPDLLAEYAPQLTIPGFGGALEDAIEKRYQTILTDKHSSYREEWCVRHPDFLGYDASKVAGCYFSGSMFGPTVSPYEHTDHAIWLLSSSSNWLPRPLHKVLLEGIKHSRLWLWGYVATNKGGGWQSNGNFCEHLYDAAEGKGFVWSNLLVDDVLHRIELSRQLLHLPESSRELLRRFQDQQFAEAFVRTERAIRKAREQRENAG